MSKIDCIFLLFDEIGDWNKKYIQKSHRLLAEKAMIMKVIALFDFVKMSFCLEMTDLLTYILNECVAFFHYEKFPICETPLSDFLLRFFCSANAFLLFEIILSYHN